MKLSIKEIRIPTDRQRKTFTQSGIDALAISLQTKGQINPVTVVRNSDGTYDLVAGFRRLTAAKTLGWEEIEVREFSDLNELQREEIELDENLMRENLEWQEEIKAKARVLEVRAKLYGETVEQAAEHLGISKGSLWEDARLAKVIEEVPELGKSKNKSQAMNKVRLLQRRMALTELADRQAVLDPNQVGSTEDYSGRVLLGDCVDILHNQFKNDGVFACVITDPPYGIDLDVGQTKKGSSHPEIYHDDHYDIMEVVSLAAREAFRLLKPDSHAYFWFDIKAYDRVFRMLSDVGFKVDPVPLVWAKNIPGQTNHPSQRWASGYEACFFCRKGDRPLLKQGQSNLLCFDVVPPAKKIHPTEKPSALLRALIEASTVEGELVLDMFGGSGSTAEAALQTGRNFVVCEKDEAYHAGILTRLAALGKEKEDPINPRLRGTKSSGAESSIESSNSEATDDNEADVEAAFARHSRKGRT